MLNKIKNIFDYPYNTLVNYVDNKIDFIKEEPNYDEYYNSFSSDDLILLEVKKILIVGNVYNYQPQANIKINALRFTNKEIYYPVLITKNNFKRKIGDIREFILKNEESLLVIAKELRTKCFLTLVNIYYLSEINNVPLEKKYLYPVFKKYKRNLSILENSFI